MPTASSRGNAILIPGAAGLTLAAGHTDAAITVAEAALEVDSVAVTDVAIIGSGRIQFTNAAAIAFAAGSRVETGNSGYAYFAKRRSTTFRPRPKSSRKA